MRLALIAPFLLALAGCSNDTQPTGPERGSAAGEVLGGEVTDDMLPLDTVQSTSPADPRAGAPDPSDPGAPLDRNPGPLPSPQVSGGPDQRQPVSLAPTAEPPPETPE